MLFGLCLGYAGQDGVGEVKPRLPQPVVVFNEVYGNDEETRLRARYDAEMSEFSSRHEMGADTWTRKVIGRMGDIKGMNGRETLLNVLRSMGFPLR